MRSERQIPARLILGFFTMLCCILVPCSFAKHRAVAFALDEQFKSTLEREIYEGFKNGPPQDGFEYPVDSSNWLSIVYNHPFEDMAVPHLAWKTSSTLEGLWYAYESTGDQFFLLKAYDLIQAMLSRRDNAEGRTAWNGKTYPLWGSNSRYNGAEFPLISVENRLVGQIQFHSPKLFDARISIKNCDDGAIEIEIQRTKEQYKLKTFLVDLPETVKKIDWSYYGSSLKDQKVVKSIVWDGNAVLKDVTSQPLTSINVPQVITQALIINPMVKVYIALKETDKALAKELRPLIREIFDATIALSWHDEGPFSFGFFTAPENSPTYLGGGEILPWNQQAPLVSALALFCKEENDEGYLEIVKKWSNHFKRHWEIVDDCVLWRYWEEKTGTIEWYEGTHYGAIVASAIFDIFQTGVFFSEDDIKGIANTIKKKIICQKDLRVAARINGKGYREDKRSLLFGYLDYAQYAPELFSALKLVES